MSQARDGVWFAGWAPRPRRGGGVGGTAPPVSDPSASGASRAATAAADPPLVPPGMRSSAHGLRTGPNADVSFDDPIANSSQLVLPTMTAPAASSRATTVASYGGTNRWSILDDAGVR